jgi:hypothetical protein
MDSALFESFGIVFFLKEYQIRIKLKEQRIDDPDLAVGEHEGSAGGGLCVERSCPSGTVGIPD